MQQSRDILASSVFFITIMYKELILYDQAADKYTYTLEREREREDKYNKCRIAHLCFQGHDEKDYMSLACENRQDVLKTKLSW